jgi:cobalt transporter subunit CbtB
MSGMAETSRSAATASPERDDVAGTGRQLWPCVAAAILGLVIVLGVGFGPGRMHNAAHDTRHTLSFPCH